MKPIAPLARLLRVIYWACSKLTWEYLRLLAGNGKATAQTQEPSLSFSETLWLKLAK